MTAATLLLMLLTTSAADGPPPPDATRFPPLGEASPDRPKFTAPAGERTTIPVARIDFPAAAKTDVVGLIAFGPVDAADAHAEMWVITEDGRRAFSRAPIGSGERVVQTPMHMDAGTAVAAEFNLVLPTGGSARVDGVRVVSAPGGAFSLHLTRDGREAWMNAAYLGGGVGLLGGLFGVLGSLSQRRAKTGRGPAFLARVPHAGVVLGVVMLAAAAAAFADGQPWGVWYGFGLGGLIFCGVCTAQLWQARREAAAGADFESRRMRAMDVA